MKRVIKGKVYNTDTAQEIARISYSHPGDFAYYDDRLYRTRRGAWFIAGEGGARSHWATSLGNGSVGGGEGIRVLDEDEALNFCERAHVDPDRMAELFPGRIEEA